ncbi:MAG: glycosyltransferase family 2 protein [Parvibaculum sp.]|uniref:glycosyltransferase family 2 protein n=1 Tax=Parvibaculum sp. TaxID=2024848 RepID=UPI0025FC004D|nr:glycosyltransferase family 2 protein [Parvibaculum sp.]MCE9650894.1 glycosyltransferase family 2 protein [Parvibaculum sp.]
MTFRACAIVPTYKHVDALDRIVEQLRALDLPVIVIDDGNGPQAARAIADICAKWEDVNLERHADNEGKGAAVLSGLRIAAARGFTHALQIDADGQHDILRARELLKLAEAHPSALVTGAPIFDDSVPRARLLARWITHVWVSINTLTPHIIDSMCGFRVYPVALTLATTAGTNIAKRMGFDTEVVVRLSWAGAGLVSLPVGVTYPPGNHSNFALWDNVEMSRMHARLFFGMLWRAPLFLAARWSDKENGPRHWAKLGERGSAVGLWFLALIFRVFGRRVCLAVMSPIILFFFLTGGEQRRSSIDYLTRAWRAGALSRRPGWWMSFRHFMSFGAAALDKLAAWTGNIPMEDIEGADQGEFDAVRNNGRGAFILTAHLGNPEVIRAIASLKRRTRVNVLVHTAHAMRFNALINAHASSSAMRMIQVTNVGPDTAIILQAAIDNGEWVVIVGDRIPVTGNKRISWARFLGDLAPFPQGPHILAAILKCPVYLLFCVRKGNRHRVFFEYFSDRIVLPRRGREMAIQASVERYAARLEAYVRLAPLQWFNFFDYWRPGGIQPPILERQEYLERELAS